MLKKMVSISIVCMMAFALVACDNDTDKDKTTKDTNSDNVSSADKPFSESEGFIRYIKVQDVQIAIPETVGEYAKYLEQVGTKVELVSNPNKPDETMDLNDTLEANNQSSLKAYFKVYMDDEWHRFGVHYTNDSDDDITISEAKIDKITLYNDQRSDAQTLSDPLPELMLIQDITLVTDQAEVIMDDKTTSKNVMNIFGSPTQNTDGYLTYNDASGFVYKLATANKKGILTQIEITYPK